MAKEYEFTVDGHPSIYGGGDRDLTIYFCEPEQGVTGETGILLLIPGFGGNASSNVYKKMRRQFADTYNLVTVQCDYFGWEFMQGTTKLRTLINHDDLELLVPKEAINQVYNNGILDIIELNKHALKYRLDLKGTAVLEESPANFNDMGIMQAIDNINAVLILMAILKDNQLEFDQSKIIIYGQSQGAYLSYLCNAFAPHLFSHIIDNSAWLFPKYLVDDRIVATSSSKLSMLIKYSYLAKEIIQDREILNLPLLYSKFKNNCNILAFHGTTDTLVSHLDKKRFINALDNSTYHEISPDKVDGQIFRSTNHGLDADFLRLFEYVHDSGTLETSTKKIVELPRQLLKTNLMEYEVDYSMGVPLLRMYERCLK
ncbi:MAG TPA: DUF2920 family protein [Bacillota bacterium]|nr:DUF2920 family protein [Bacillota bacterium]